MLRAMAHWMKIAGLYCSVKQKMQSIWGESEEDDTGLQQVLRRTGRK